MTEQTAAIDRIPLTHSVRYVARGLPEVPNQYGPGVLAPSEITLTYRTASDSQLGRVHAYVAGRLRVDGAEVPLLPGGLYGQHYDDGLDGWPAWLAEEARLHDPDAPAVPAGQAPTTDQTAPVDWAGVLREEAARIRAHCPDHLDADSAEGSWMDCHCAVADDMERRLAAPSAVVVRRATDETAGEAPDVDPVYDPRAWEAHRRDAGCGCTAPAPVECKVPHGTGAWLCVCHRLSGPPVKDTDPPGKPIALLSGSISKHFLEPNRCLSTDGIFRCSRPVGHLGDHRTGRTVWRRRAEDAEQPAVGAQQPKEA